MTCSTCDGYEFVPNPDGSDTIVACMDCPAKVRCIVHGRIVGGKCSCCAREARKAVPLVVLSSLTSDLRALAIAAAQPIERSAA
jgi:hypothetical protein